MKGDSLLGLSCHSAASAGPPSAAGHVVDGAGYRGGMTLTGDTSHRRTLTLPTRCGCRADFRERTGIVVALCQIHAAAGELLQALEIFGSHHRLCYRVAHGKHSTPDECDCGLDAALRNAGGKPA